MPVYAGKDLRSLLSGYLPDPSGIDVRIAGVRGGGTEVGGAQVVVADQLELTLAGLVWTYAAIAGRLAYGLARPYAGLGPWLASPRVDDFFVFGLRTRVMPCRVLAHDFPPLSAV